jgi:hypothetical protein
MHKFADIVEELVRTSERLAFLERGAQLRHQQARRAANDAGQAPEIKVGKGRPAAEKRKAG